jgi:CRISPR/Cas system CSM-associated protein Csm3 (group 7 of RAMP superfamily)
MSGPAGNRHPFIPGSAIRGPLRHALERHYRANGEFANRKAAIQRCFGDLSEENGKPKAIAAALLVSDAHLSNPDWQAAWFQLHAEDEFTAGAYGSSKFDRLALIEAEFTGKLVLETPVEFIDELMPLLEKIQELATSGQVSIGGGQWRGHGSIHWDFDAISAKTADESTTNANKKVETA